MQKQFTVSAVDAVSGVTVNSIADGNFTGVRIARPQIFQNDLGLYAPLSKKNVSDVSLGQSKLFIKEQVNKTSSSGGDLTVNIADISGTLNATFAPFDGDRYSISRNNASDTRHSLLDSSQVTLSNNNTTITFKDTDFGNANCAITVTLEKDLIDNKTKNVSRSNSIGITSTSQIGISTNGLAPNNYYGFRVQDKEISLNTPDVLDVLGIFESTTTSDASAPKMTLSSIDSAAGKTSDMIIGEKIKGLTSGAIGIYAERISDTQIAFLPSNGNEFKENETVQFLESNIPNNRN